MTDDLSGQGLLPYNGSSGFSGTDTSEDRARLMDESGVTGVNQRKTVALLERMGYTGLTWKELADLTGWHHGTASGALSVLHKERVIARLRSRRGRCRIYVLPSYTAGRDTDMQGRKQKVCPHCGGDL